MLGSARSRRSGGHRAFELAALPLLRHLRGSHPRHDDRRLVHPSRPADLADEGADAPVRVRRVRGSPSRERRFTVSFYLTAILFILFDIEIVFLYPLAVQLDALGWFGIGEFLVFIAILGVAYVYVWRKGALNWQ